MYLEKVTSLKPGLGGMGEGGWRYLKIAWSTKVTSQRINNTKDERNSGD